MQTRYQTQSGATTGTYETLLPLPSGAVTFERRGAFNGGGWVKTALVGAALVTTLSQTTAPTSDWYTKITAAVDSVAYTDGFVQRGQPRLLTRAEQAALHKALRRSAKLVYKAKRLTA